MAARKIRGIGMLRGGEENIDAPEPAEAREVSCNTNLVRGERRGKGRGWEWLRIWARGAKGRGRDVRRSLARYITGGTVMPMIASAAMSSRRTTATVAGRNCFAFSSGLLRMGWGWEKAVKSCASWKTCLAGLAGSEVAVHFSPRCVGWEAASQRAQNS